MLQDNKGSVYVDGVLMGSSDTLPILKSRRHDISHFYFGGGENSSVTIKNVFLYNRPLNAIKLKAVYVCQIHRICHLHVAQTHGSHAGDSSTRADVFRVSILLLLGLWGFAVLC
ncbi:surface glycoprotein [Trypanosoma rangeli]|uniref:Surface glycoprotein n=1 Tax=Trypanosoma rangeli TaxID=5698 RepID=A0A422MYJ9_TRYRA|nr:surface glycoprotein [Trypanosoma rangeli]RNE98259.1 surface glycoprotein [Trypanosoma rangeli]|eukprot:RNE98259.1 surface glycoprotein [Trypanosoma rangeli]